MISPIVEASVMLLFYCKLSNIW